MKALIKTSMLFYLLVIAQLGYAQSANQDYGAYLYLNVDKLPKFNGGINALSSFVARNIKYPDKTMEAQGKVLLSFVILKMEAFQML